MKLIREILLWIAIVFTFAFLTYHLNIFLSFIFENIIQNAIASRIFTYHSSIIISSVCVRIAYKSIRPHPFIPDWCISKNLKHYVAAFFGTAVIFTLYFLAARFYEVKEDWVAELLSGDPLSLIFAFLTILVLAPVSEEVTMRWWGIYILKKIRFHPILAVIFTSAIFALLHIQYEAITITYLFVLACWFGFLRLYTNSISVPIVAHMLAGLLGSLTVIF